MHNEALWRTILTYVSVEAPLYMLHCEPDGRVVDCSGYARRISGDNLPGCNVAELVVDFTGHFDLASLAHHNSIHMLHFSRAGQQPIKLMCRVLRIENGFVLFGYPDIAEFENLGNQLLKLQAELHHTSRQNLKSAYEKQTWLRHLLEITEDINQLLISANDLPSLLEASCQKLVTYHPVMLACLVVFDEALHAVAVKPAFASHCLDKQPGKLDELREYLVRQALAQHDGYVVADLTVLPELWQHCLAEQGINAIAALPLRKDLLSPPLGVVAVCAQQTNGFAAEEMDMLRTLRSDIGFAIHAFRLRTALHELNRNLEQRVQLRTDELEQLNATLSHAKSEAESASHAKSRFLANMSHELRTPLNAILGFSQMMARAPDISPAHQQHLNIIHHSGEHLLGLINDILNMSKIEAGRMALESDEFDLLELLYDVESLFAMRAHEKGLSLNLEITPVVPRRIITDQAKLRQILFNLMSNAIKFTDHGGILIHADSHPRGADTVFLRLSIEDSGMGIADNERGKLFEPFEQTRSGREKGGTGLGLVIVKQYAELMGGHLDVHSREGQGSRFSVVCQVKPGQSSAKTLHLPTQQVLGLATGQASKKILVIDEVADNRQLLVSVLRQVGFEVQAATTNRDAPLQAQSWQAELIFIDVKMSDPGAHHCIQALKTQPATCHTPLVAISASVFAGQREQILDLGCDEFIPKPYYPNQIYQCIAKHLNVHYRYENWQDADDAQRRNIAVQRAALAALPDALQEALQEAAVALDWQAVHRLAEDIASHNPALAQALHEEVTDFRFDIILAWLE